MKLFAYIFTAILCLSFSHLPISAQKLHSRDNRDRRPFHHNKHSSFSQEEFKKQKEAYFVRTIPLSSEEAQTVLAYIHQLKTAQRNNDMKIRNLRNSINAHTSSKQCLIVLRQIRELQYANLKLETDYQKKFLKVLSPYKYLRLLNADNEFDRKMLNEMVNNKKREFPQKSRSDTD